MRILLAGASGMIGLPLVGELQAVGHDVTGLTRSPAGVERLQAAGAEVIRADVLDRAGMIDVVAGRRFDAMISQLTSLAKPPAFHRDMAMTKRLRTQGTANLLAVAERVGAGRFLTQSMMFGYGYGDFGDRVLTEDDQFAPPGEGRFEDHLAAMRSNEVQVLGCAGLEGMALRYGLFYGPGPGGDTLVSGVRKRVLPAVRNAGVKPWIYIEDAAAATVAALERGARGNAYNVVDDRPVSFSEIVISTAEAVGAPRPVMLPAWLLSAAPYAKAIFTGDLRLSNAKAKRELNWAPRWPTCSEGIADLAAQYRRV